MIVCVQLVSVWLVRSGCEALLGRGWISKVVFWAVIMAAFVTTRRMRG